MEEKYDSIKDYMAHVIRVKKNMAILMCDLEERARTHDMSKTQSPEKEGYDKYIPLLRTAKYGTEAYNKIREDMRKDCLDHHYEVNRHHPEHFENGIRDFTIVDLFEYFVDCYSSSLLSDTPFEEGVKINAKKHNLPPELVQIFINTVREYF